MPRGQWRGPLPMRARARGGCERRVATTPLVSLSPSRKRSDESPRSALAMFTPSERSVLLRQWGSPLESAGGVVQEGRPLHPRERSAPRERSRRRRGTERARPPAMAGPYLSPLGPQADLLTEYMFGRRRQVSVRFLLIPRFSNLSLRSSGTCVRR